MSIPVLSWIGDLIERAKLAWRNRNIETLPEAQDINKEIHKTNDPVQ